MAEDINEQDLETKNEERAKQSRRGGALANDPFFQVVDGEMEKNETLEERRLRMTKQLLDELKHEQPTQNDFFNQL